MLERKMGAHRDEPPPQPTAFYCTLRPCKYADVPYASRGALGSHRRKHHGIIAISQKIKRPPGGTIPCDVLVPGPGGALVPCPVDPYVSKGGLGLHKWRAHGIRSEEVDSVKKRDRRAGRRSPEPPPSVAPVPPISGVPAPTRPRQPLTAFQYEQLRRRLHWLVLVEWSRGLPGGAHPSDIRLAVLAIIGSNFAPARLRASAADDAESISLVGLRARRRP